MTGNLGLFMALVAILSVFLVGFITRSHLREHAERIQLLNQRVNVMQMENDK